MNDLENDADDDRAYCESIGFEPLMRSERESGAALERVHVVGRIEIPGRSEGELIMLAITVRWPAGRRVRRAVLLALHEGRRNATVFLPRAVLRFLARLVDEADRKLATG